MSRIPPDLKYTRSHEWLRSLPDGSVEIGISDHAQEELGDLVFIELPQIGRRLASGEACAVVESVKAASDIYAPIAGTVLATNEQLAQAPDLVNRDPYGSGWLMRMNPTQAESNATLLSAQDYSAFAEEG
ncbi:MAG TPA: glycine cleavage system protein GcvH [Steroidobacteraceae bacterium]|jgi:glycine cleavage system H protein|nr:glycine cleavage system protein GcvH [Steroidobacteraceae bacterium]